MKLVKKWNNWWVFLLSVAISLLFALLATPYYLDSFLFSGGFLAMKSLDLFDAYVSSFLLLYTFSLSFFYRSFSKDFKPINLIYFLALPFLLFVSSLPHVVAFAVLLTAGLLLGLYVEKLLRGMRKN